MGKTKRQWQDTDYVLGYFGKSKTKARKGYESFVKAGLSQGRKKELTGGGLIRSLGGWIEAREILRGGVHIMREPLGMEPDEVYSKGRQDRKVKARSLLCFWAARALGISHTELAKKLEMSLSNYRIFRRWGELIAKRGNYSLEK